MRHSRNSCQRYASNRVSFCLIVILSIDLLSGVALSIVMLNVIRHSVGMRLGVLSNKVSVTRFHGSVDPSKISSDYGGSVSDTPVSRNRSCSVLYLLNSSELVDSSQNFG